MTEKIIKIVIQLLWGWLTEGSRQELASKLAASEAREASLISGKNFEKEVIEKRKEEVKRVESGRSEDDIFGSKEFNK